jgi:dihydrofolate synthase / folylpolyglutamate synthase
MITDRLTSFINNESLQDFRQYSPDQITRILDHFGAPHRAVRTIHIAGTNGKGSTAHMLNSIFTSAGYSTGLFTSPHLMAVNERIRVGNVPISDDDFSALIDEIIDYTGSDTNIKPTYFDILTACAFRYFRERGVDIAIIETGLGGRLDSTNVIIPLCSIITEISIDHAHILGDTTPRIAREKAGIIKNGVPAVTSNIDPEILAVLEDEAKVKNAPLYRLSKEFSAQNITRLNGGFRYDYSFPEKGHHLIPGIEVPHPLEKQVDNSSSAITASLLLRGLFPGLTDDVLRLGLNNFSAPGRFQILSRDPLVIFDPAHNVAAFREMIKLIRSLYPLRRVTPVLAIMKDKDIAGIMSVLEDYAMTSIYFALDDPRCYRPGTGDHPLAINEIIHDDEVELARSLDNKISGDSLFFFIGSFRLYGAAMEYAKHHGAKCC